MNFQQAVQSGFRHYAASSGRASRSEYWYWTLFALLVGIVASILDLAIFPGSEMGAFSPITTIVLLLPNIAVGIRRLHDRDYSGWWLLLSLTVIGAILLIVWFCMRGTPGPNRFGSPPI